MTYTYYNMWHYVAIQCLCRYMFCHVEHLSYRSMVNVARRSFSKAGSVVNGSRTLKLIKQSYVRQKFIVKNMQMWGFARLQALVASRGYRIITLIVPFQCALPILATIHLPIFLIAAESVSDRRNATNAPFLILRQMQRISRQGLVWQLIVKSHACRYRHDHKNQSPAPATYKRRYESKEQ